VVGRLGFHDPLDDGARGPLGYLVCGWFADTGSTRCRPQITSVTDFYAALVNLGWSLPPGELEKTSCRAAGRRGRARPVGDRRLLVAAGLLLHVRWWASPGPTPLAGHRGTVLGTNQGGPPDPVQTAWRSGRR